MKIVSMTAFFLPTVCIDSVFPQGLYLSRILSGSLLSLPFNLTQTLILSG